MTAYEIAVRIDNFGYMNDTYEYNDQIDPEQREDNILGITKFLEEKDDVVIAYLNSMRVKLGTIMKMMALWKIILKPKIVSL